MSSEIVESDRPDPEAFKAHMRTAHAGDDTRLRNDDFVGSYDHTGRVKLEKKKWTPKKPDSADNAFRADDWMGSGAKPQRRSWQVKSTTNVGGPSSGANHKTDEFVSANTSPTATRKWAPPPKENAIPPPWVSSPTGSIKSPRASWHPTSQPFHASDHTKDTSVQSDMSFSDLNIPSTHSHVKDAIERLSGSMTHVSIVTKPNGNHRAWQSQSALNHNPRSHDSHNDSGKGTTFSNQHDEGSHSAYELDSEDEGFHEPPEGEPHVSSPGDVRSVSDDHDHDKPDPEQYRIHIRSSGEGSMLKHHDFVGSYNHTGRTKLEPKKWTPPSKAEPADNVFKSDDWMGSGKTQRKSWQVKSPTKVGTQSHDNKSAEFVSPSNAGAQKWKPPSKDNVISSPWMSPSVHKDQKDAPSHREDKPTMTSDVVTSKPTEPDDHEGTTSPLTAEKEHNSVSSAPAQDDSAAPSLAPAVGYIVGDDDGRPDPEEYKIHMRTVHAGDDTAMRHDDFVGSYSHTGRVKLEKKKWTPASKPETGDNAFRSDDWMGSGKTQKRTWQVKSPTHVNKLSQDDRPADFVSSSDSATQKWTDPAKDHPVSQPILSTSEHVEPEDVEPHQEEKNHTVETEMVSSKPIETVHQEVAIDTPDPNKHETSPRQSDFVAKPVSPVAAPGVVPAVGCVVGDDDGRPNPEEFKIHMRTVHAGDDTAMRHDDFVGSYSHTGRVKLEKKKWTPASKPETGDNAFRSDDWMGSGAPKKRSWKATD